MKLYKVVLIGESGVGKSSAFFRFKEDRFVNNLQSTIGLDQFTKKVTFKKSKDNAKETVEIQLWDTAGLEKAGRMTNNYYKYSQGVLLMYDVADEASFSRLQMWHEEADKYTSDKTIYFVVGNKTDLSESEVEVQDASVLSFTRNQLKITDRSVFKISVKTGEGFEDMFNHMADVLTDTVTSAKIPKFPNDDEPSEGNGSRCC